MDKVKAIITGGKDQFGVWIEGTDIFSAGDTIEELKNNLSEAIELHKDAGGIIPKVMEGKYEIEYTFDVSGFLRYYSKFINFASMRDITGINQKQLWNYAYGYRKPRKDISEKIIKSISNFAEELSQVQISL
ncbi:type II toxin-antitoxin system HicB family antitoxin [Bacteroides sp. 519]|uniref:type II toxin-antitoxin system HicB family antitoxin n=1 Tax=Bacteroides sp. 519 TaxID=2302937 RepID=UPI0013D3653D|nr:type II toxin-antitoxin system HicB family antitoxin [Bacteroides sp. 519]NDV56520.1 hypothetical protein [Bacteroides sp. 519]